MSMKKIIKLKESDLLRIIKNVVSEQGLGRRIPSDFGQDIVAQVGGGNISTIQKKLKELGYNLGSSGPNQDGIDSVYGRQTKLAVQDFQRKNKLNPDGIVGPLTASKLGVNPISDEQIKILKTGGVLKDIPKTRTQSSQEKESCKNPQTQINPTFLNKISYLLPSHLRFFLFYLSGKNTVAGYTSFKEKEINYINSYVNQFCRDKKSCNGTIDFYNNQVDFKKLKQGKEDQFSVEIPKQIAYTLGNAQITDRGNYYLLTDVYDFNNYKKNPENYSLSKFPSTVSIALNKIFCNNWIQGVEELASYKQALGYTGFPIALKIPKS